MIDLVIDIFFVLTEIEMKDERSTEEEEHNGDVDIISE